ncbi:hypothetical protein [Bacillus sp. FJAT-27225]|uniref:hypothetical protein n=1 Tax=Bacillus sp. FJAT-27225 TaxID=1743144 RepID=UPI0015863BFF|nr:hypothetical protein [Bacillus sp. FJAT-27225]
MPEKVVLVLVLFMVVLALAAQIIFGDLSTKTGLAGAGAILLIVLLWFKPNRRS